MKKHIDNLPPLNVSTPEHNIERLDHNYNDLTKLFISLTELYKAANDKTVIDEMIKHINNPILIVRDKK
jgi:hypothetical protein